MYVYNRVWIQKDSNKCLYLHVITYHKGHFVRVDLFDFFSQNLCADSTDLIDTTRTATVLYG